MVDFNRDKKVSRPRRQAMVTMGMALIGWVACYHLGILWQSSSALPLNHPPRFFVDLETATVDELQLLPDVGSKTARAWRQTFDESKLSSPKVAEELEALPNVGPIRSSKLAPFLVESEIRSTSSLDSSLKVLRPSANP